MLHYQNSNNNIIFIYAPLQIYHFLKQKIIHNLTFVKVNNYNFIFNMNLEEKYKQLQITTQKNRLPALSQKSHSFSEPKYELKNANYEQRLQELSGSIRMLQKKYKQNLKQGFQNKIKSFRIQAVLQRKVIKATIQQTKKEIEHQQLKDKLVKAQNQRERESKRFVSIQERVQQKRRRVRTKAQKQKSEVQCRLQQQNQKLSLQNKQIHDRLIEQSKHGDKKKIYFQNLRKEQNSQEISRQKKQYMQKIIENKQTLEMLKNQLAEITRNKKKISLQLTPFITI